MSDNIELTRKLAESQKEVARLQERISVVEKERTEYLQNISHQLVAPLNAIKWHIENLTEARVSIDRARKVLRSIYSQATIAVHLAKNFNLMSNLEEDHRLSSLKEPLRSINLQQVLVNLADDFQPLAWDQEIDIHVDKAKFPSTPAILGMRPLLNQVFSNIIENAIKYSNPQTKIVIEGRHDGAAGTFHVLIRNRGIPLPAAHEKDVFERGFRTPEAKSKYPAGTGFGLYIARRIVEIHEGSLSAVTTADGWTVFEVVLTVAGLKGKARYVAD
jgi:signal transduction histidine kinase